LCRLPAVWPGYVPKSISKRRKLYHAFITAFRLGGASKAASGGKNGLDGFLGGKTPIGVTPPTAQHPYSYGVEGALKIPWRRDS